MGILKLDTQHPIRNIVLDKALENNLYSVMNDSIYAELL